MSILSKIQALITAANNTTGESDTTLTDAVQTLVDGYGQGGTTITDGIVVKSRNANGYPTEIDFYGNLWPCALSYSGEYYHNTAGTNAIETINLKTSQTSIPAYCFNRLHSLNTLNGADGVTSIGAQALCGTKFTAISFPNLTTINVDGPFSRCSLLETVNLPSATGQLNNGSYPLFQDCTALTSVTLGSVGHTGYFGSTAKPFMNCVQNGLTITLYTAGNYVDQSIARIRYGATNATIIIKASEATTYGGVSYAAGDTILISEVTS